MDSVFDVCVMGGGLFGSAAAKYSSEDCSTILIGPREDSKNEFRIFGAWFDEGRITSPWFKTQAWREFTRQSVKQYRNIEADSETNIFTEVGFLNIESKSSMSDDDLQKLENLASRIILEGTCLEKLTEKLKEKIFPFLNFPADHIGHFAVNNSGHISPRNLVLAQKTIARKQGCHIVDGYVTNVERMSGKCFKITFDTCEGSGQVSAKKLILAPGAYVNLNPWFKNLLPEGYRDQEPDLTLQTQTVAYLEVTPQEAARLKTMPTIVTGYAWNQLDGTYILPPILYPDGKYYLKLGHGDHFERTITNERSARATEARDWYESQHGCPAAVQELADFIMKSLIPDIEVVSVHGGCCITVETPGKLAPYIDTLCDDVTLVCGGNGYGAKCSNEIGRLAAKLATRNSWESIVPQEDCKIIWRKC